MDSPDELCQSCNHKLDDHKPLKCEGVYNVFDVHGDETVGCACRAFDEGSL